MKTIKNNTNHIYIINKSKFITFLYKINSQDDINNYLNNLKKEYKDATHICYGYILNNTEKFSDDNEPNGTAGMPILNVLKKNELTNVLCCVVRYFGGIKLGAGGLTRAYTKSVTECLQTTDIIDLKEGYLLEITFSYDNTKIMDLLLKDANILNKEFNNEIIYKAIIDKENIDLLKKIEIASLHTSIIDIVIY